MSVSFEEAFDAELAGELGDLGPDTSGCATEHRWRPQRPRPRSRSPAAPLTDAAAEAPGGAGVPDRDFASQLTRSMDAIVTERIVELANGLTIATDASPGRGRWRSASGWRSAHATSRPSCPASATSSSTCCSRARRRARATDISRAVDRVGGDINAFTSKEYTAYYCRHAAPPRVERHRAARRRADRSLLDDDDVESERQVILEELAMDDDSPDDVALRTLARQLFGDHGLGRDTAGERSTVRSISAGDIRDFFATHYRTGNTTVAIAGDVDHDEIGRRRRRGVRRHARR